MKRLTFLVSGEFLFAAFLLANIFKSALPELPIDLNVILFVLTVASAIKRIIINPKISKIIIYPTVLFLIFIMYVLFTYLYSPSQVYGLQKIVLLFTFSFWCFIAPFILINTRGSLKGFLKSFLLITVIITFYGLATFNPEGEPVERFGIAGANSIGLGRAAALGTIILILMYLFNKNLSIVKKFLTFIVFISLLLVLFLTGARMALISLVIALLIYVITKTFSVKENKVYVNKISIKVASSFLAVPIILIPFWDSLQFMIIRLTNLFNSTGFGSYTQRTNIYSVAIEMWNDNLLNLIFGNGIGSYTIFFDGVDDRFYPHNILLEVLSETGIIGLTLFLVLIISPFFMNNHFKSNYLQVIVMLMFIYTFLNANTTGDINDNRMMFTFLALMYAYPFFNNTENKSNLKKSDYNHKT